MNEMLDAGVSIVNEGETSFPLANFPEIPSCSNDDSSSEDRSTRSFVRKNAEELLIKLNNIKSKPTIIFLAGQCSEYLHHLAFVFHSLAIYP